MPRKKKAQPKKETFKDVEFIDGPMEGRIVRFPNPPWPYIKLGMPEWSIYSYENGVYTCVVTGEEARLEKIDPPIH
jgi:hypothetical protein